MTIHIARAHGRYLAWGPTVTAAKKAAYTLADWRIVSIASFDFHVQPRTLRTP